MNKNNWTYYDIKLDDWIMISNKNIVHLERKLGILDKPLAKYFIIRDKDVTIPIAELIATRARIDGIVNSFSKMREASNGVRQKRTALTVCYDVTKKKFLIRDGNSTYFNLLFSGFDSVICRLSND